MLQMSSVRLLACYLLKQCGAPSQTEISWPDSWQLAVGSTWPPTSLLPIVSSSCCVPMFECAVQVLCRMASFTQGLVLLYDRMRLHREVLQVEAVF